MLLACSRCSVFSLHLVWLGLKRYLSREKRKAETVFDFKSLHPYEQLAVIWLLDAGRRSTPFIRQVFAQSGLLKGVMEARMYPIQQQYPRSVGCLKSKQCHGV